MCMALTTKPKLLGDMDIGLIGTFDNFRTDREILDRCFDRLAVKFNF